MAVRPVSILLVLCLALAGCVGGSQKLGPVFMDSKASIGTLVNAYRRQVGLNTLSSNAKLNAAAAAHARDMAKRNRLSHTGGDGSSHVVRAKRAGYGPFVTENVAAGQRSTAEVMRGWIGSSGHRKNLKMDPATHYGFAHARAPGTKYKDFWVLLIGRPPPEGDYQVREARPGLSLSGLTDWF